MRFSFSVHSRDYWQNIRPLARGNEVLLEHRQLGRLGELTTSQLIQTAHEVRADGGQPVLVFDIIAQDPQLEAAAVLFQQLDMTLFTAVRVQDAGVAYFSQDQLPLPIQLILETGHHNLESYLSWVELLGARLQRIVVSNELPLGWVQQHRSKLPVGLEYLALGPILLFYTPRKLVSPWVADVGAQSWSWGSDSDRRRLPVHENHHGTYLYYEKLLFLLPHLNDMEKAGVDCLRLDLRLVDVQRLLEPLGSWLQDGSSLDRLRAELPRRATRGFFKSNRTDKQFVKLKRQRNVPEGLQWIGTVVDTRRGKFTVGHMNQPLQVGDEVVLVNSLGQVMEHRVAWVESVSGERVDGVQSGLAIFNHARKSPTQTLICRRLPVSV